jgi:hypothetical protein
MGLKQGRKKERAEIFSLPCHRPPMSALRSLLSVALSSAQAEVFYIHF